MDRQTKTFPAQGKSADGRGANPVESPPGSPGNTHRDYEILVRLKEGDPDAFKEVFSRWDKALHHFLTRLTGSVQDAEDIAQDAFVSLWQYHAGIDPSRNIQTYIFLIGKQLAWKLVNNRKRLDGYATDDIPDVEGDPSFEKFMEAEEMEIIAENHVKKMPPRTREVYNLYHKENMTYEQIADKLHIKPNAVRSRMAEARHILKDVFTLSAFMFLLKIMNDGIS